MLRAARLLTPGAALMMAASILWMMPSPLEASASTGSNAPIAGPIQSQYENASHSVRRDDGLSVPLPNGKDLWIFGDTDVYSSNSFGQMVLTQFITGGTGAEGAFAAGQIPTSLLEVPTPGQPLSLKASNPPEQFPPAPTDVYLPDGSGRLCSPAPGQYSARWATGAALIPNSPEVLVTYGEVCVTNFTNFTVEGWGFMEYNWKTNALDVAPDDVFPPAISGTALAPALGMGSPVVTNSDVSLFSSQCASLFVACSAGQVYFTTLSDTQSAMSNPASYNPAPAATDGSTTWQPVGTAVASYPDAPYRMIETTAITGAYDVLTATSAGGPWHLATSGVVPGCQSVPSGFCYALVGHPELSTPSQLVLSYFDPGAGPYGTGSPVGHLVAAGSSYPANDVGVEGSDGALWVKMAPSNWISLGGALAGAPAVAAVPESTGPASPLYIVTGTDHALWIRSGGQGWQRLSNAFTSCIDNPAAVVTGPAGSATLTVACQGSDHALWMAQGPVDSSSLPSLNNWTSLGGTLVAGPAVAPVGGNVTFLANGTDGHIWSRTTSTKFTQMPWRCLGHPALATSGTVSTFACDGTDHALWYATDNNGSGWSSTQTLGGILVDGPGVGATSMGTFFSVEGSDSTQWQNFVPTSGSPTGWVGDGKVLRQGAGAVGLG